MANKTTTCPECSSSHYIKKGKFKTKHNHQPVLRYQCKDCNRYFSSHTTRDEVNQHKPHMNLQIFKLISSGVTQRWTARILGINKNTVARKIVFLAKKAQKAHEVFLKNTKTSFVQFDEMETYEHTKLKPLSIAIAVRAKTGQIISTSVATMKPRGRYSEDARRVYRQGRLDTRDQACREVLDQVNKIAKESIIIATDKKVSYPLMIKETLPQAKMQRVFSHNNKDENNRKEAHEMNAMWKLNHVSAKLRSDLPRLARKTWCTTKCAKSLQNHLWIYTAWNNGYKLS